MNFVLESFLEGRPSTGSRMLYIERGVVSLAIKVTTPKWDRSRSATPTLSTNPNTACLQTGHIMFAIQTLVIKSNQR